MSWERRKVGQVVVLVIDALRADFVFPNEMLFEATGIESEAESKIEYLANLVQSSEVSSGVEAFVAKAHSPTVTMPRIKVRLFVVGKKKVVKVKRVENVGADVRHDSGIC